jgi:hypothetical protein
MTGGRVVAIYRLLENSAFDPQKASTMIEAYEEACRILELSGSRTDQLTELVARKIVEIAQTEVEADPQLICQRSLHELGIRKH